MVNCWNLVAGELSLVRVGFEHAPGSISPFLPGTTVSLIAVLLLIKLVAAVYIPTYSTPTELIICPPVSFSIILVYQMPECLVLCASLNPSANCTGFSLTLLFPISFISCHAYLAKGQVHVCLCSYLIVL